MRAPYTQIFMHLVWATWDRLPLLTPEIRPRVYGAFSVSKSNVSRVRHYILNQEAHHRGGTIFPEVEPQG